MSKTKRGGRKFKLHEPGFEHLSKGDCYRMTIILRRILFLQGRIKAAESHGIDLSRDRAEVSALQWAVEWIRETRKETYRREESSNAASNTSPGMHYEADLRVLNHEAMGSTGGSDDDQIRGHLRECEAAAKVGDTVSSSGGCDSGSDSGDSSSATSG